MSVASIAQEAMGTDFIALRSCCHQDPTTPFELLHMSTALLRMRTLINKHFSQQASEACSHRPEPLSDKEWRLLCETVGVLEACAEADRNIRSEELARLAPTLVTLKELKEYMSDETLYVPEPNQDLDAHRVELQAEQLNSELVHLRQCISKALEDSKMGDPVNRHERLCALLDLHNSNLLLSSEVHSSAWNELRAEFVAFKGKMTPAMTKAMEAEDHAEASHTEQDSTCSGKAEEAALGKRKQWQGALSKRKEQRRKMTDPAVTSTKLKEAELDSYKAALQMSAMSDSDQDVLEWWLERCGAEVASSGASGSGSGAQDIEKMSVTQLPVLSHIAAQYNSVDSCSIQAKLLLQDVGFRMSGLERASAANRIENMLFLRLNKQLVGKPL